MFSKKPHIDVKKSTSKIQDVKKDPATRLKHLKIILENVDIAESKGLFEANFSHVYMILYDSFIQAETNLRQRELSFHLVHKAHKEELDCALWVLENILALLPELLHKRWQIHSLRRILTKLLHPGNNTKLRCQAIKYFLMWYQALGENAPRCVHEMFASLVPGFSSTTPLSVEVSSSVFHDTNMQHPVSPSELLPLLPPTGGDRVYINSSQLFLETVLQYMITTVIRLEWHDKASRHHQCFQFLLNQFKTYYLQVIFPNFSHETSLYQPILDLPTLRKPEADNEYLACRVSLIKWIVQYMHRIVKRVPENVQPVAIINTMQDEDSQQESSHHSLDSAISINIQKTVNEEELASAIVRDVLCSTRENVNFVHEVYRQAFLLNFIHSHAIHRVIALYKDMIQMNMPELPQYLLEPSDGTPVVIQEDINEPQRPPRLRNDSYIGAVHKENFLVRAGFQNMLQIFMTHASNVFLQEVSTHVPSLLEEQTDSCKRVLNIYRYMVMHTRMESTSWEQLLLVLLQITSLVLSENPPKKKMLTLGGKLAPAIFQTLIVTWIKANLNVIVSRQLWDRFLHVLADLTQWEELVKEWAKTMDTLTRVLARHVYGLDLADLPLDRLLDQKIKRTRRLTSRTEVTTTQAQDDTSMSAHKQEEISLPDGQIVSTIQCSGLARCFSETSLHIRGTPLFQPRQKTLSLRRSQSLGTIPVQDHESTDQTRSPSPAPSSGLESTSIKDSPIQIDVLVESGGVQDDIGEHRGIVCGGTVRGWLPDVAVILWRRMLSALGDVNQFTEPKLHAEVFEYLVHLTDTLIKIKQNQGISGDNQSTPEPPELVPPLTLIVPWCFEALFLPHEFHSGKLSALRLLSTITLHCDVNHRVYLPQFYRALHSNLVGSDRAALNVILQHLGPRFLSLRMPGHSLMLLDLVHACHSVLSSNNISPATPRTNAVSTLADLLSLANSDMSSISVLQPDASQLHVISCPDIKEHVVGILLRAGRYEPTGVARCVALSALGIFVYKELSNGTFHPKIKDAITILLLALKFNHKVIAQVASDILVLLCEHASVLYEHYPRLAAQILCALGHTLVQLAPLCSTASDRDRALSTKLLLCFGEWCMRLGPHCLLELQELKEDGFGNCLLLTVFKVLNELTTGISSGEPIGLTQPSKQEDFDPIILVDNLDKPSPSISPSRSQHYHQAVTLCARTVLLHLVTHLGHFPMAIGASRLSSLVAEHDDIPHFNVDELSSTIFSASNIQLLMLTSSVVTSLIELPILELPGGGVTAGLKTADKQVRVLLRDQSGKASWDASVLYRQPPLNIIYQSDNWLPPVHIAPESLLMSTAQPHLPQHPMRNRPPGQLPEVSNAAPDLDQLDDLLQYLGYTSPECLESSDTYLNEPVTSPCSEEIEQDAIGIVLNQRNSEIEYLVCIRNTPSTVGYHASQPVTPQQQAPFQYCRLLFSQLGLSSWDHRKQLYLLEKSERLLRELRNLDTQRCRETHKVAVIYIGPGQEDKNSILSNSSGSQAYEQFLAGLAWEVELESHTGFMGGLQRQGSTGDTAPYYATSFLEMIFHVATRMPGDTSETILSKTRHLGNDEVHIVWSEHNRDYRRDILPTEFCDVLIVIYPLGNNLNRITVNCKPEVPYFGPLFNEAIVESSILPGLVRATVISASRAKRSTLPFYQQYYEERSRSLDTVFTKHIDRTTYEDFVLQVFSPLMSSSPFCTRTSGTNSNTRDSQSCTAITSTLTAALLDHHTASHSHHQHKVTRGQSEQSR